MKVKKICKNIPVKQIKGSKEIEITGLSADSKIVSPGNLFIAKRGKIDDGNKYIEEAIQAGAVAILSDIYNPFFKNVTQIIVDNVIAVEGQIAAEYYEFPSDKLLMVGITGTNGKTTTSYLVKHILDGIKGPCGLIGTIEYIIGGNRYRATRTTPDVHSNHKMLKEMVSHGCRSAVMEVTSHALTQGRVENIDFDIAIFSNLTLDHLDYHQTMDHYCAAKCKLFQSLKEFQKKSKKTTPKLAIVNIDSPWHQKILSECGDHVLTYGIDNVADLSAANIKLTPTGTSFLMSYRGKSVLCSLPLVGRFNVYNCLSATLVALSQGMELSAIAAIIATFPSVRGRLEPVENPLGLKIYIDFAHSDDALVNVLSTLQEFKKGKIITVFGCGGDRDKTKRPKMAQGSEEYSDLSIITSDNPRSEDPLTICKEIAQGFKNLERTHIEIDRKKAIQYAIDAASPEDIVLIAGKGHETNQIFAHKTIEFDDRKITLQLCQSTYDCR